MTTNQPSPELSPADQRIVDAFIEAGFNAEVIESPSPDDRRRTAALTSLFELLEDYPVEDGDSTLVHATLARIDRHEHNRAARMSFNNAAMEADGRPRRRLRLPDFISVAAVILIGASVIWPVSTRIRQHSIDLGCDNNLRVLASAFDQYAGDWGGAVPTAQAGLFQTWTPDAKNAINLKPLIDQGYCNTGHLRCPGNELPGESYSYQFQTDGFHPHWGVSRMTVLLGDRNPLVDAARAGQVIATLSGSLNHGGRGENVLCSDGTTQWLVRPVVAGDNIWLPGTVTFLREGDRPTDPGDVFLAH